MKKTQIIMNKPVYLGLLILDRNKTKMYDFWYGYIKPKYGDKSKRKISIKIFPKMLKQDSRH